jgi:DNA-binding SARP family transcriptional activator
MISGTQQRRAAQRFTRALLTLVIAFAFWLFRPGVPELPRSFSAPLTIETIESVVLWLLWLISALLALVLFTKMRRSKARPPLSTPARSHDHSKRSRPRAVRSRFEPPSLVIVSPEHATAARAMHDDGAIAEQLPSLEAGEPPTRHATAERVRPRIFLLGSLVITGGKRSRRGLRARALELIAYLALHPRPVHRDELLEAFWPGEDPRRTRPRLRQAVRDARRLLGDAIAGEGERYWLDRAQVDVDLDELERLLAEASRVEFERAPGVLEGALRLFRGEPLAGSDYAWSETELPRLRATFVDLLEQVGRRRLESVEARVALELAERGLEVDALNESLWRLAMEAESALGLREAVAERYERLRALLDERLGLEPAQETRRLHFQLLAQT